MSTAAATIQVLDWEGFERGRAMLAERFRGEPIELIVGLARGGLPLAVCLSHDLDCRAVGTVLVTKTHSDDAFALLDRGTVVVSELLLPEIAAKTILVVDDIVACGDAFTAVAERLRAKFGNVCLLYGTIYADVANIRRGPYAAVLERLQYAFDIDNSAVWITFPWERDAA
jgi:hypoxanthine phosphoribosyltransferase